MDKLKQLFENIFFEDKPVKLIFSSKRRKSLEYSKVTIKPISSKDEPLYQAEYTFEKKSPILISLQQPGQNFVSL